MDRRDFPQSTRQFRSLSAGRGKMSPAERISDPWYVAVLKNHITTMRVVQDRSEAIAVACAMLGKEIEVIGVGPMLDTGQQAVDPASLREIYRQRRRLDDCRAAADPVLEDTSVSYPQVSAPKRQR